LKKLSSFRGEAALYDVDAPRDRQRLLRPAAQRQRQPMLDRGDDLRAPSPPAPDHADSASVAIDVRRALLHVPEDFR
jgi:hypothetical protein